MQTRSHEPAAGSAQLTTATVTYSSAHSKESFASLNAAAIAAGTALIKLLLVLPSSAVLTGNASGNVATGLRKEACRI